VVSYSGGGDQEDNGLRIVQAKIWETLAQRKKLGVVVHSCHPSYIEKHK
jgi:hypothetical protein